MLSKFTWRLIQQVAALFDQIYIFSVLHGGANILIGPCEHIIPRRSSSVLVTLFVSCHRLIELDSELLILLVSEAGLWIAHGSPVIFWG